MILGLSIQTFTIIHVIISLLAIASGIRGAGRHARLDTECQAGPPFFC